MLVSRFFSAVCVVAISLAAGSAAAAEPLDEGATLCLYPIALPFSDETAKERRPSIQEQLSAALIGARFRLPDPAAVEALEQRVRREVGGFVDVEMGTRDGPRYQAYLERLASALHDELGCDAQLHASVVTLRARFTAGVARWDGYTQKVSSTGRIVMSAIAGVYESGWVGAFSLWLSVVDLEGNPIAFRSAGIETPVQFAVVEDSDVVPEDRWLKDPVRIGEAIYSALGPGGESLRRNGVP
jgi:hypothetical protein